MNKDCYVKVKSELVEAEFIGVYQYSQPIGESIMVGGHKAGIVAYPVAVVKLDGKLKEVNVSAVTFKE